MGMTLEGGEGGELNAGGGGGGSVEQMPWRGEVGMFDLHKLTQRSFS